MSFFFHHWFEFNWRIDKCKYFRANNNNDGGDDDDDGCGWLWSHAFHAIQFRMQEFRGGWLTVCPLVPMIRATDFIVMLFCILYIGDYCPARATHRQSIAHFFLSFCFWLRKMNKCVHGKNSSNDLLFVGRLFLFQFHLDLRFLCSWCMHMILFIFLSVSSHFWWIKPIYMQ